MDASPYAPPKSAVADVEPTAAIELYSPRQIQAITFLFGPMAGAWLISRNFRWLSDTVSSRVTLCAGAALTVSLLAVAPFLPPRFPAIVLAVAYSLATFYFAKSKFAARPDAGIALRSGWRNGMTVAGIGLIWLLLSMAVAVGGYLLVSLMAPGFLPR